MEIKKEIKNYVQVLIVFCVERPIEEGAPLSGGIELCRSSSYLGGLRSFVESLQYSTNFSNLTDN